MVYGLGQTLDTSNMTILALVQPGGPAGNFPRVGVTVGAQVYGPGANLIFTNESQTNSTPQVTYLADGAAWGANIGTWSPNGKYWMEETIKDNVVTYKYWPADGTTPESAAATSTACAYGFTGYAGFAMPPSPSGAAGQLNVYYALVENSDLPSITVGTGAGSLPTTTTVSIAPGANWDLNGSAQSVAALSDDTPGNGGSVINSNFAGAALTLAATGGSTTFSGAIQGGISLTMAGSGTQVLAGNNTYTGSTMVSSGVLEAAKAASLPGYDSGSVTVAGGATLAVQPGNGTLGWSGSQIDTLVAQTTWSSSASVLGIDTVQGDFSYSGSISQVLSLTKLGPHTLTLTGSNTYTGLTTVSGGTLQLGDGTANHDGSVAGDIVNNAALVYNLAGNQTFGGTISGNGNLAKSGTGTLALTNFSNYSGATLINGGTLKLQPPAYGNFSVVGFGGSGSGWTGQSTIGQNQTPYSSLPAIAGDVATLTDNNASGYEATSVFYNNQLPIGRFTANFIYRSTAGTGGVSSAGAAFVLQNDARGTAALGAPGGYLGIDQGNYPYTAIQPSAEVLINNWSGVPLGSVYTTNGQTVFNGGPGYLSSAPIDPSSGDPIQVQISYDGSNYLTETLTDLTTHGTWMHTYTVGNLAAVTGGSAAYIGLAGGEGFPPTSLQTISNFSFVSSFNNILPTTTPLTISNGGTLDMTERVADGRLALFDRRAGEQGAVGQRHADG